MLNGMKPTVPLLILALLASGCGLLPAPDKGPGSTASGPDFHAIGQEPGWLLDIHHGGSTVFEYDYAQKRLVVDTPQPQPLEDGDGTLYRSRGDGHALRVEIRPDPCTDVMSGKGFSHTVTVTLDERRFKGCGTRNPAAGAARQSDENGERFCTPVIAQQTRKCPYP